MYRPPDEKISANEILRLSIIRLLRIRRTLDKYHTSEEILELLRELQVKYNYDKSKQSSNLTQAPTDNTELLLKMMNKIDSLTQEVADLKKQVKPQPVHHVKSSCTVGLQANSKEIAGIVNSRNVKLPKIFKSDKVDKSE